jgi:hypothetical protein
VTKICYTTIVACFVCVNSWKLDFIKAGSMNLANDFRNLRFPDPTGTPDWANINRMFYGMSKFRLSGEFPRLFYLNT